MESDFQKLEALIEAGTPFKDYPEQLRLCILRLKWLGVDVTQPIDQRDFEAVAFGVKQSQLRNEMSWLEEAERGEINRHIREHVLAQREEQTDG